MWTVKRLSEWAHQTPSYIRRRLREGFIKGDKPGRDWTIPDEEAEKYLEYLKQQQQQ